MISQIIAEVELNISSILNNNVMSKRMEAKYYKEKISK